MAKTSKVQKFYIENNLQLTNDELSKITGVSTKTIDKFRRIVNKKPSSLIRDFPEETKEKEDKKLVNPPPFIRNEKYGATVMTQSASEVGDEATKKYAGKKDSPHIFKIKKK